VRLARFRDRGATRIGIIDGTHIAPIDDGSSNALGRTASMRAVIESDAPLRFTEPGVALDDVTLEAPIDDPRKIVAIGLNYMDHATEGGVALPAEPLVFAKFTSSIVGPQREIRWPAGLTSAVDYEAELAVVIGRPASRVSLSQALDHVFGYTCLNDVSARDIQFSDGQWVRAKSIDTFCPMGPWVVTADEIPDPQALRITCVVSGETMQSATTADMYFSVAELISRLSHSFTLETGDVIATGTPPGVGWFREPRRLLDAGDIVTIQIEGIGELTNPVAGPEGPRI
jgi:2-keto-4-pentenoate hydratase/2-oxohepta-3-ene-1,7-dioic acid hydratase in catechol pathway